jgi:hypothetical protein
LKNIEPPRDVFSEILGLSDSVRCPFDEHSAGWFSAEDTSLINDKKPAETLRHEPPRRFGKRRRSPAFVKICVRRVDFVLLLNVKRLCGVLAL